MKNSPPRWLSQLLEKFIDPQLFNGIYGDLIEAYNNNLEISGKFVANWKFAFSTLGYFRYFNLLTFNSQGSGNNVIILLNYFKSSFRNLTHNKENTAISLIGLTVSFTAAIAIFQYTHFESSYDQFSPNHERVYRVSHNFKNASDLMKYAQTFFAAKDAFEEEIPEIEISTHLITTGGIIKRDEELFDGDIFTATTPEFFDLFKVKLLKGNAKDLLDPSVIMLSESIAQKYFGLVDPLGKSLEIQNVFQESWVVKVAGVYEDLPQNTHLTADIIIPIEKLSNILKETMSTTFGPETPFHRIKWRLLMSQTYVQLFEDADVSTVTQKANTIVETNRREVNAKLNQEHSVWLQPIGSIHTTPGLRSEPTPTNDLKLIYLFNMIGILILSIAWINYINITTARAVTRAKEVGIRKILGSHKSQLRILFLLEALIINFTAFVTSFLLLRPVYPWVEDLVEVQFFTGSGYNLEIMGYMGLSVLIGSLLSGLYPAFVLSNYQPIQVLKGKLSYSSQGIRLRRILVVLQLVFSLFLISSLFIVQRQMDFMINHSLGMELKETILLNGPIVEVRDVPYANKMESLKNELKNIPGVQNVSISSMVPGIEGFWRASTEERNGEEAGIFLHRSLIDEDYIPLYGLEFLAGRNFDPSFGSDKNALIINELTAQNLGHSKPEDALNEKIYFSGNQTYTIIGVVNNFYQRGVQFSFEPRTFQLDTLRNGNYISIRFQSKELTKLNQQIETTYASIFPQSPFNSRFLDDIFQAQYDTERRFRNLFTSFTAVALVVACLGLIGLASYLLNQKSKEVSIRKVLGARTSSLFLTLNKEYLVISIISFIVTIPVIIYLMQQWLNNYANRVDFEPGMFIYPFLIILSVILLITLRYTFKVIGANPATVLREDG